MRAIAFAILAHAYLNGVSRYNSSNGKKEPEVSVYIVAAVLLIAAIVCAIMGL